MITVQDVYNAIDARAPFASQEPYDHCGLQVGSMNSPVHKVLAALDLSREVVAEAVELGCDLILTHHPFIWSPLQTVTDDEYAGGLIASLIRHGIAYIATHTNVDKAEGGHSETIAKWIGGRNLTHMEGEECVVLCDLDPVKTSELLAKVKATFDPYAYLVGEDKVVTQAAVCSGAGCSDKLVGCAMSEGRVYLSGEFKHHQLRYAADIGGNLIGFGHYQSEAFYSQIISDWLSPIVQVCRSQQKDPITQR